MQTIGEGVGNAVEVVDALSVLQGKHCLLRDISVKYATEMLLASDKKLKEKDVKDMVESTIDSGAAYRRLLEIVKYQGGDVKQVSECKILTPVEYENAKKKYGDNFRAGMGASAIKELLSMVDVYILDLEWDLKDYLFI